MVLFKGFRVQRVAILLYATGGVHTTLRRTHIFLSVVRLRSVLHLLVIFSNAHTCVWLKGSMLKMSSARILENISSVHHVTLGCFKPFFFLFDTSTPGHLLQRRRVESDQTRARLRSFAFCTHRQGKEGQAWSHRLHPERVLRGQATLHFNRCTRGFRQTCHETIVRVKGGKNVKTDRDEPSPYAAMLSAQLVAARCKESGITALHIMVPADGNSITAVAEVNHEAAESKGGPDSNLRSISLLGVKQARIRVTNKRGVECRGGRPQL